MRRLFSLIDGQLEKTTILDTTKPLVGKNSDITAGLTELTSCSLPDLSGKSIALDFETTPRPEWVDLKQAALDPLLSDIRTIQVSDGTRSWLIDTRHVDWKDWLRKTLVEAKEVIAHNARFEAKNVFVHLGRLKINWKCTYVASILCEYTERHSLASVSERWIGVVMDKAEQIGDWGISELSRSQVLYALRDVSSMHKIYNKLDERLEELGMHSLFHNVECKIIQPLAEIEINGLPVNLSRVQAQLKVIEPEVLALEAKVQKTIKYLYNKFGDTDRLQNILWKISTARVPLKIKSYKDVVLTKVAELAQYFFAITGDQGPVLDGPSISKQALFDCIHRADFVVDGEEINLISMYLEYKRRSIRLEFLKRLSTPWEPGITTACLHPVTRRIHTEFKYAVTGRILAGSGSGHEEVDNLMETKVNKDRPWMTNIQQFPRDFAIRSCFGFESYEAEDKDRFDSPIQDEQGEIVGWEKQEWTGGRHIFKEGEWCVLSSDYSALEAFILAHLTNDTNLISAVTSQDFHSLNASAIYQVSLDEVKPWQRQVSKNVNYCTAYGGGPPKIAQTANMAFIEAGLRQKITVDEAAAAQKAYFSAYPGIDPYLQTQIKRVQETGWTVPTKLGRTRNIRAEVSYEQGLGRKVNEMTKAFNNPMQATNADILKLALLSLYEFMVEQGTDGIEMGPPVHDEQIFFARRELMPKIAKAVAHYMKASMDQILSHDNEPTFNVKVKPTFGPSWGHAH